MELWYEDEALHEINVQHKGSVNNSNNIFIYIFRILLGFMILYIHRKLFAHTLMWPE